MGVSTRHTRRILTAYRKEGATVIAHGNRGRRPANATPETISTGIVLDFVHQSNRSKQIYRRSSCVGKGIHKTIE